MHKDRQFFPVCLPAYPSIMLGIYLSIVLGISLSISHAEIYLSVVLEMGQSMSCCDYLPCCGSICYAGD